MRHVFIMLLTLTLIASCGGESDEPAVEEQTADTQGSPVQMIVDEEFTEFEKLVNASIKPYFDEEATETEKVVKTGEPFDIYVFAEFNNQYPMSAAEYKLELPEGVSLVSQVQTDSLMLSRGKYNHDFMIVFHCSAGPKIWLARYTCKVDDDFAGGKIETMKGADLNFLGFTLCDVNKTMVRAKPGTASMKVR